MMADEEAEPTNIVIFDATGDLTKRKLIPALLIRLLSISSFYRLITSVQCANAVQVRQ